MEAKERILVKAHELYNRYGIRSVSMDDIATQVGISKKTVYQHYTDKDQLVDAIFTNVLEENKCHCIECKKVGENAIHEVFISMDMVKDMLENMNPAVLFDMQKYHPTTYKKFQDYKNQFLFKIIKENLQKGTDEGLYRDDINVDIMSRYRLYSIMLSFDSDVFPTNKTNLLYIEQQLLEHFLYGLSTIKGQKLIQKYKNQRIKKSTEE